VIIREVLLWFICPHHIFNTYGDGKSRKIAPSWNASMSRRMQCCLDTISNARDALLVSGDMMKASWCSVSLSSSLVKLSHGFPCEARRRHLHISNTTSISTIYSQTTNVTTQIDLFNLNPIKLGGLQLQNKTG
jgi:hypothetical protein